MILSDYHSEAAIEYLSTLTPDEHVQAITTASRVLAEPNIVCDPDYLMSVIEFHVTMLRARIRA